MEHGPDHNGLLVAGADLAVGHGPYLYNLTGFRKGPKWPKLLRSTRLSREHKCITTIANALRVIILRATIAVAGRAGIRFAAAAGACRKKGGRGVTRALFQ